MQCFPRLMEVELDIASELGDGAVASSVEECECPVGHTGTSCEVSLTVIPEKDVFSAFACCDV